MFKRLFKRQILNQDVLNQDVLNQDVLNQGILNQLVFNRQALKRQLPKILSIAMLGLMGTIELAVFQAAPAEARLGAARRRGPKATTKKPTVRAKRKPVRLKVGAKPASYRVGGFSRNSRCGVGDGAQVVAPSERMGDRAQQSGVDFLEQTTLDKPTFFVHLPKATTSRAKLTVQTEAQGDVAAKQIDRVVFDLNQRSGIVAIPMSQKGEGLAVGQRYLWQMTIYCDASAKMPSVTLSGWVERVTMPQPPQDLQERVSFYAENGVWQDAMGSALQLRQQGDRSDWMTDWSELMEGAELGQFKNAEVQVVAS
jgi:hypothetical protein